MASASSEHNVLRQLFAQLSEKGNNNLHILRGPGDDAAIFTPQSNGPLVWTVDTVTEGQDYRFKWPNGAMSNGVEVGWKAVAQNLSDINAMGAHPLGILVSITSPRDGDETFASDVTSGILQSLAALGVSEVPILGGDLGRAALSAVTITILGQLELGAPTLYRSGAKAGDRLYVSGTPGFAGAGLAALESAPMKDAANIAGKSIRAQLYPRPLLTEGRAAARAGATSGIDVSDGILNECSLLAAASHVGIDLSKKQLAELAFPLTELAQMLGKNPQDWVLSGGEDYCLLYTMPSGSVPLPTSRQIGVVTEAFFGVRIDSAPIHQSTRQGWDPWSS